MPQIQQSLVNAVTAVNAQVAATEIFAKMAGMPQYAAGVLNFMGNGVQVGQYVPGDPNDPTAKPAIATSPVAPAFPFNNTLQTVQFCGCPNSPNALGRWSSTTGGDPYGKSLTAVNQTNQVNCLQFPIDANGNLILPTPGQTFQDWATASSKVARGFPGVGLNPFCV